MPILDLGHKTIDAEGLVIVRPISDADLVTANTKEPWATVVRKLDGTGGFSLKTPAEVVADAAKAGIRLTTLSSGEAINARLIKGVAPFKHKEGAPNIFSTTVHFHGESNGKGTWLKAPAEEVNRAFAAAKATAAVAPTRPGAPRANGAKPSEPGVVG